MFHTGDVYDLKGKALLEYCHPKHIDKLAVEFPNCKIVIAHFGFPHHLETANIVSKNNNVFVDISGTIDQCDTEEERENLLNQYTQDLKRVYSYFPDVKFKTIFGTDYGGEDTSLNQVQPYIKLVENVFSKEEQESVFHGLAEKLYFE